MREGKDATPMNVISSITPIDFALLDILLILSDMA